jgi:presqualene diphosphate synthase
VRVFGMGHDAGIALAHHLGRALQLTNILRDLDEDASLGRLYLPRDLLHAAGIAAIEPHEVLANPAVGKACAAIVDLAEGEFRAAQSIMAKNPRRVVRAPRIMGEAYHIILQKLIARGFVAPREPVRLPKARLLLIVVRNLI